MLFGRRYDLRVANRQMSGLRVQFSIQKSATSVADTGSVTVWGLSRATVSEVLAFTNPALRLNAGYRDRIGTVFVGRVRSSSQDRDDGVVRFKMDVRSGGEVDESASSRSYASGTLWSKILQDLAGDLGYGSADIGQLIAAVGQDRTRGPFHVAGPTATAFESIVGRYGFEWFVSDDAIHVRRLSDGRKGRSVLLSSSTGLLGLPEVSAGGKLVQASSLIQPDLLVNDSVTLKSAKVNGTYVIRKALYVGDTHGQDWKVKLELRRPD